MNYHITPYWPSLGFWFCFPVTILPPAWKVRRHDLIHGKGTKWPTSLWNQKQISDLGYRNIEDAGYKDEAFYGMQPLEYKAVLDSLGLVPISSHQAMISFDNVDQTIADLKSVGFKYLVVPIPPMGQFTYDVETNKMGMTGRSELLARVLDSLGKKVCGCRLETLVPQSRLRVCTRRKWRSAYNYLLRTYQP